MTMVLGVKDDENKFDMMVRNCVAHDGQRAPIQLVDERGCVVREKIMSPFKKVKNFDATANVLSYAYFQAFKFPDSMNVHFQCVVQVCRSQCPEPQCGGASDYSLPPAASTNNIDSYGAPAAAPISTVDSYGAPLAPPNSAINPRNPSGNSQRRVSVVTPGPAIKSNPIPLNPGYNGFNKRIGEVDAEVAGLGGRPRSLEFDEGVEAQPLVQTIDQAELKPVENVANSNSVAGDDKNEQSRRRRSVTSAKDANGNRVISVRRVKRETVEEENDVDEADIETERVIQVVSPTDVQFKLAEDDKDEVVINLNSVPESLCLNTAAFIGVTVTFVMLLIIASIVIVFLWLRIRTP